LALRTRSTPIACAAARDASRVGLEKIEALAAGLREAWRRQALQRQRRRRAAAPRREGVGARRAGAGAAKVGRRAKAKIYLGM
jgi:hypothetical protein